MKVVVILLVLVTKCPYMSVFYDDTLYKEVHYLGYCRDEDTAEIYAKQFKYSSEYYVYSVDVSDEFLDVLKSHVPMSEIIPIWSPIKRKYYAFSDAEADYLEECLLDSNGSEFDDLEFAIETLERFGQNDYVKKTIKRLKNLHKIFTEFPETLDIEKYGVGSCDELFDQVDRALNLWFAAKRIGLFDCTEYIRERCGGQFG